MASLHDAVFLPVRCHRAGMILVSYWINADGRMYIKHEESHGNRLNPLSLHGHSDYCHDPALSILQWALKEGAEG